MMDGGINNRLESLKKQVVDDHLRQGRRIRLSTLAVRVLTVTSVLAIWEMASGWLIDPFFFTSPSAILRQTIQWIQSGTLWFHLQFTLLEL
jgi:NitT/TauT family transport system permease protein